MKQNERILVYAVTGFLAVILAIAVLFGGDNARNKPAVPPGGSAGSAGAAGQPTGKVGGNAAPVGLGDLVNRKNAAEAPAPGPGSAGTNVAGAEVAANADHGGAKLHSTGSQLPGTEQPLVVPKPLIAADLVQQALGSSRRDRAVRFVPARRGDSLETLVRRWCGSADPFLEEAKSLNEELTVVRLGQEVAVPWVDDEIVFAAHEARQPKKLVAEAADQGQPAGAVPAAQTGNQSVDRVPAVSAAPAGPTIGSLLSPKPRPNGPTPNGPTPTAAKPGAADRAPADRAPADPAPTAGTSLAPIKNGATKSYVVKSGDSLWKIAEKLYGKKNADRMVGEIKKLNPGKVDTLRPDQKLVVPEAVAAAAPASGA